MEYTNINVFDKTKSAFKKIIDKWIVEHIGTCTEALQELGYSTHSKIICLHCNFVCTWSLSSQKYIYFISMEFEMGACSFLENCEQKHCP